MKKVKSVLSLFLCLTLVLSLCIPAFAAELTTDGSDSATVAHTVAAEFTAAIPAYVVPSEPGETSATYAVVLEKALIPDNHELTAKVEYSGTMTEQNDVELPYVLTDATGNTIASGSKILTKAAGNPDEAVTVSFGAALTAKARYAGVYSDTATFTFDVAEKVYTIDEINADTHLYAIGKTKPEYVVAQFNEDYSEVTIFKNGDESDGIMMHWNNPVSPFTENGSTLKAATIEDGVVNINHNAFLRCTVLTDVSIPDSVTDIGNNAFFRCDSLQNIIVPGSVTRIGNYAFSNCKALTDIAISEGTISIGDEAFKDCDSLTDVTIPHSVTSIGKSAFYSCDALTTVNIMDSATDIGNEAFAYCKALTNITIPGSVTSIGPGAFHDCKALTDINILNGVTKIDFNAFKCCSALTSISIPDSVTSIGDNAFYECYELKDVVIGKGVTSVGKSIFLSCNKIENITIKSGIFENYGFNCRNTLKTLTLENEIETIAEHAFSGYSSLVSVRLSTSLKSIEAYAFSSCSSLTDVTIPSSVISIGGYAFDSCKVLTNVNIPESVTSISSYAFRNSGLQSICGISGSYAETFAAENGYTFIAQ